ncbi:unnamed protein product, partial [Meganyctiphanes norvegica]
ACPGGFFMSKGSSQCFKYFAGGVTWDAARNSCNSEGLQMAMPANDVVAVALRKDLFYIYGHYSLAWLGARGGEDGMMVVVTQQVGRTNATFSPVYPFLEPPYAQLGRRKGP